MIRGSDESLELYNIEADPDETNELSDSRGDMVQTLKSELDTWLASFEHAKRDGDVDMQSETREQLEDLGYLQ
jgi:hypothetical protein